MAKTINFFFLLLFLFCISSVCLANNCVKKTMESQIGVRENLGVNDGVQIRKYLKAANINYPASYCAAFVKWVFLQCGIKTPITAWSPTAHNSKNIVYFKNRFEQEPKCGDVFTIYSTSQKRIVHTGFFYSFYNTRIYETIEGNTNDNGSSNGDGVYKRKRSYHQTYSITKWL